MSNRRRLTEAERERRRRADRERVKEAARQLLCSEGWKRWVRTRQTFHNYSLVIWGATVFAGEESGHLR